MTTAPRVNDGKAKPLRTSLRAKGHPCHICGGAIDYAADHLDPWSFQLDHLWQIANGGPAYEPTNTAASHRACNRDRSDKIDDIAIAAAAAFGVTLTDAKRSTRSAQCAAAGTPCRQCNGTHDPQPGTSFETSLTW
jgi:hypothetical protein